MYTPQYETENILDQAWGHINSVPYSVTARWVFYRLLQDGTLDKKSDYKKLLGYLSKARKQFYKEWKPSTLADDTRASLVRGRGFFSGVSWLRAVKRSISCDLDKWDSQPNYVEVWFEAAAMKAQFEHYTHEYVTLLAFHGDVSIPEKWNCAKRIYNRWNSSLKPITILYYGDLDPKGLQIPISAESDIINFIRHMFYQDIDKPGLAEDNYYSFLNEFTFRRVGINEDHPELYDIPENPERPGTFQWEALDDNSAQELISEVDNLIDIDLFKDIESKEDDISQVVRNKLSEITL